MAMHEHRVHLAYRSLSLRELDRQGVVFSLFLYVLAAIYMGAESDRIVWSGEP